MHFIYSQHYLLSRRFVLRIFATYYYAVNVLCCKFVLMAKFNKTCFRLIECVQSCQSKLADTATNSQSILIKSDSISIYNLDRVYFLIVRCMCLTYSGLTTMLSDGVEYVFNILIDKFNILKDERWFGSNIYGWHSVLQRFHIHMMWTYVYTIV